MSQPTTERTPLTPLAASGITLTVAGAIAWILTGWWEAGTIGLLLTAVLAAWGTVLGGRKRLGQ